MLHQHPDRDLRDVAERVVHAPQLGHEGDNGRVQRQQAAIAELHDRDAREGLGDRRPVVDRRRRGRRPGLAVLISNRLVRQHLAVPDHQQAGADDAGLFDLLLEYAAKHRDPWRCRRTLALERGVAAGKHDGNRDKPRQPGGPQHLRQYKRGLCSRTSGVPRRGHRRPSRWSSPAKMPHLGGYRGAAPWHKV